MLRLVVFVMVSTTCLDVPWFFAGGCWGGSGTSHRVGDWVGFGTLLGFEESHSSLPPFTALVCFCWGGWWVGWCVGKWIVDASILGVLV